MDRTLKNALILAIIVELSLIDICMAAPSITGVSGAITKGQTITLSGASFGIGPTIYKWDDFENGTNGAVISNGWATPMTDPHYTNTSQRTNSTLSAYSDEGTDDLTYNHGGTLSAIFTTFWTRINWSSTAENFSGNYNNKWIDILDYNYYLGGNDADPMLTVITQWSYPSTQLNWRDSSDGCSPSSLEYTVDSINNRTDDTWERVELYAVAATDATGTVLMWQQTGGEGYTFEQVVNRTNVQTLCTSGSDNWSAVTYGFMSRDGTTESWFDDIYIASSMARVEVGDNSIWANCTHREIQIPTEWKDDGTSITLTFNQGSFADGGTVYLYVVDAEGNVGGLDTDSDIYRSLTTTSTTGDVYGYPITIVSSGDTSTLELPGKVGEPYLVE